MNNNEKTRVYFSVPELKILLKGFDCTIALFENTQQAANETDNTSLFLLFYGPGPTIEELSLQRDRIARAIKTNLGTEFFLTSRECTECYYATSNYLFFTGLFLDFSTRAKRAAASTAHGEVGSISSIIAKLIYHLPVSPNG